METMEKSSNNYELKESPCAPLPFSMIDDEENMIFYVPKNYNQRKLATKTRNETPILKADKQEPRSMNLDNTTFPRTKSKITQGQYCPRYPVSSSFYLLSLVLLLLFCRKIIFCLISHHESSPRKGIKEPASKSNNKHI